MGLDIPKRGPGAHIRPTGIQGHHHRIVGLFHHCIVDGIVRASPEVLGTHTGEIHVGVAFLPGSQAGFHHLGLLAFQFFQVTISTKQKHAAVPEIITLFQILAGGVFVWFFHKGRHIVVPFVGRTSLDVAVASVRRAGHNTKGNQLAGTGGFSALTDRLAEHILVLQYVIRRHHQQQLFRVFFRSREGRECNGRSSIATDRLENDPGGTLGCLGLQMGRYHKPVLFIGDGQYPGFVIQCQATIDGFRQQGIVRHHR